MTGQSPEDEVQLQRSLARVVDFALRALGADRAR
jgi:hypothetical protein